MVLLFAFFCDDLVAELDAFITDLDGGPRNQLTDLVLALSTEGSHQFSRVVVASFSANAAPTMTSFLTKPCLFFLALPGYGTGPNFSSSPLRR